MYYSYKNFSINLNYVTLLKCMYTCFLESQIIAHDVKPEIVNFFIYAEFRLVNVDIPLSLLRVYFICIDVCLIYLGVNRSHYVPR